MFKITARSYVILALLISASAGAVMWRFFSAPTPGFPASADGTYMGNVQYDNGETALLFIDRSAEDKNAFVTFAQKGSELVRAPFEGQSDPLSLKVNGNLVRLSGRRETSGALSGALYDVDYNKTGNWYLIRIAEDPAVSSEQEMDSLRAYLELDSQLKTALRASAREEIIVTQQKSELERIRQYVEQGEVLKNNADQTFKVRRSELATLQETKTTKLREAAALGEKFSLSQRLVGMGKLVGLARDVMDRENRWVDSMFSSASADFGSEFEEAVARAERIKSLKQEIQRYNSPVSNQG